MADLTPEERITRLEHAVAEIVRTLGSKQYKSGGGDFQPSLLHKLHRDGLAEIIEEYKETPRGPAQVLSAWTLDDVESGDVLSEMRAEVEELETPEVEDRDEPA